MSHTPCINIVVTAFNMEDCLQQCLASLAAQTYDEFEAFIIEDGSSDSTPRIADSFALTDSRFHVIHTPNLGAAAARNHGMTLLCAPFFMLLDGDDVFYPTMLESLHRIITETSSDVAVCNITQFDHASGSPLAAPWALKTSQLPRCATTQPFSWREIPGNLFAAFMGWPWDKLYRTDFIHANNLSFPEDLSNSEDMLFTYQALVLAQRICVTDEVLIEHRVNRGSSVSSSRTREPLAFYDSLCRMKQFLQDQPQDTWDKLQQSYLSWALDWTLWNIETLPNQDLRLELTKKLACNEFSALELTHHEPLYFVTYPRSMARYATLLIDQQIHLNPDQGPLGALNALPYGKFKPWEKASFFEKIAIRKRIKENKPTEW